VRCFLAVIRVELQCGLVTWCALGRGRPQRYHEDRGLNSDGTILLDTLRCAGEWWPGGDREHPWFLDTTFAEKNRYSAACTTRHLAEWKSGAQAGCRARRPAVGLAVRAVQPGKTGDIIAYDTVPSRIAFPLSCCTLRGNRLGNPTVAEVFDAQVSLTAANRGLFLIVGRRGSPANHVRGMNGQVVYRLPNDRALLAAMPIESFMALRGHREIAHIGPVMIDGERFNQFLARVAESTSKTAGGDSLTV